MVNYYGHLPYISVNSDGGRTHEEIEERELRGPISHLIHEVPPGLSWDSIVGNEEAKRVLTEAVELSESDSLLYSQYKISRTKGVVLFGPPGCGKTMLVRVAASVSARHKTQSLAVMIKINGAEVVSCYMGATESTIRSVFSYAKAYRRLTKLPLLVFVDEADALLGDRRRGSQVNNSFVSTFLTEMDGLEESSATVVVATNRPDSIDSAIMRPGRCDRTVVVGRPSEADFTEIVRTELSLIVAQGRADSLSEQVTSLVASPSNRTAEIRAQSGKLSYVTLWDGVSGAMARGLVERAKLIALRRDSAGGLKVASGVTLEDFREARDSVLQEARRLYQVDAIDEVLASSVEPVAHVRKYVERVSEISETTESNVSTLSDKRNHWHSPEY